MDALGYTSRAAASLKTGIDRDTFNDLVAGRGGQPREMTLRRIADWTGVDIRDVRELAGRPRGGARDREMPEFFHELTDPEWDAVVGLAKALHSRSTAHSAECGHGRGDPEHVMSSSNEPTRPIEG